MAVFFKNDCKYEGCGKIFPTTSSLIEHIEGVHLDFSPKVIEGFEEDPPVDIPLSYVLRYSQSHSRQTREVGSIDVKLRLYQHASKQSNNAFGGEKCPTGHQLDDEELISDSESSNDSWTPSKEVTTFEREFFSFKYASNHHTYSNFFRKNGTSIHYLKEKPFACAVPGCKKRYKNINGIKYHYKNGHKVFERPKRSIKHLLNKKNRERNLKAAFKKIYFDNHNYALQLPSTSRAPNVQHSYNTALSYPREHGSWTENNNLVEEKGKITVKEDIENFIPTLMPSSINNNNNNDFNVINCNNPTNVVNACSPWPIACATTVKNEVTIIRPTRPSNDINNAFVTYNYSAS